MAEVDHPRDKRTSSPAFDRFRRRAVYLEDELDDADGEIDFGEWLPDEGKLHLPGLCSTNCHEVSVSTCAQHGGKIVAQAPVCNSDAVKDIARQWPPSEPYALARPSVSGEIGKIKRRRHKERFNYAKALLRDETELENLHRFIHLQIIANEAERCANAGLASFRSVPSTIGFDIRRNNTFSEGDDNRSAPSDHRMKLFELRDVTEVIPQWRDLHSHMRTHLFRRRVHESYLVFHEDEKELERGTVSPSFENHTSDIARQSLKFFGDFADMTMTKLKTHGMLQKRALCKTFPREKSSDDASQVSGDSSCSLDQLQTLSSHLSPSSSGNRLRRPVLSIPPGLVHPDETYDFAPSTGAINEETLDLPLLPTAVCDRSIEKSYCLCEADKTLRQAPRTLSRGNCLNADAPRMVRPEKSDSPTIRVGSLALFDSDDEDDFRGAKKSPRPTETYETLPAENIIRTPKQYLHTHSTGTGFATPAGLRDIRGKKESSREVEGDCGTPEIFKARFEPSSIVESNTTISGSAAESVTSALHKQDALYLALPAINSESMDYRANKRGLDNFPEREHHYPGRFIPSFVDNSFKSPSQTNDFGTFGGSSGVLENAPSSASLLNRRQTVLREHDDVQETTFADLPISPRTVHLAEIQSSVGDVRVVPRSEVVPLSASCVPTPTPMLRSKQGLCSGERAETALSERNEEKKECESARPGACGTTFLDQEVHQIDSGVERNEVPTYHDIISEGYDNIRMPEARHAVSFDLESHDDDSSVSLSVGNDENSLFQASTWGGRLPEERMRLRKTFSWPPGSTESLNFPANISRFRFRNGHLIDFAPSHDPQTDSTARDVAPCHDNSGICHTFPSTDENFQVAVEEMIARLSPTATSWGRDPYVTESENTEFLNNYFYCTKVGEGSNSAGHQSLDQHACVEPWEAGDSLCHNIGVDALCTGIRFIFSNQPSGEPAGSKPHRQRTLSLDARPPKGDSTGWLRKVERLFDQFGSSFEPSNDDSQDSVQFAPPYLKKTAQATDQVH